MANPINRIIKRLLLNRKLTHTELDNNFQYGNFWEETRIYTVDMVVIKDDEIYRALQTTTQGSFIEEEWQIISASAAATPGGGSSTIGLPTDGNYGSDSEIIGEFTGIAPGDRIEDALDKIESFFAKIVPANAPLIGTRSLDIPNLWAAKEIGTGTLRSNITELNKPIATVSNYFADGGAGILSCFIDSIAGPTISLLKTSSQAGTYTNSVAKLTVTEVGWPLTGQTFYEALGASIEPINALAGNNILHTYQINHNTPNSTVTKSFYVDTLSTPVVLPLTLVGVYASSAGYVSGVPALKTGDKLRSTYNVNNAVSYFFNQTRITKVESAYASGSDVPNTPQPTTFGAQFNVINHEIPVISNVSSENANVSITAYNARGTALSDIATGNLVGSPSIRIDSKSSEANRLKAGVGQFPALGGGVTEAGSTFDPTISLATAGNEELQMYFGNYRYPTGNYSGNAPTVGPNYSSVPAGTFNNIRWVLLNVGSTGTDKNSVTLTFNNPVNFGSSKIIPNFYMYVRIEGTIDTNGWIDGNVAFNSGTPTNNGDAAYNFGASTVTTRNITFGTQVKNGAVWVRVGIPPTSSITFSGITLS